MYRPVLSAFLAIAMLFPVLAARGAVPETQTPPAEGAAAPNFSLKTLGGQTVELAALTSERPVVLLVLRGWPGYQCPLCTKQVHEFVAQAAAFKARGAQVLMVYPGPAEQLVEGDRVSVGFRDRSRRAHPVCQGKQDTRRARERRAGARSAAVIISKRGKGSERALASILSTFPTDEVTGCSPGRTGEEDGAGVGQRDERPGSTDCDLRRRAC